MLVVFFILLLVCMTWARGNFSIGQKDKEKPILLFLPFPLHLPQLIKELFSCMCYCFQGFWMWKSAPVWRDFSFSSDGVRKGWLMWEKKEAFNPYIGSAEHCDVMVVAVLVFLEQ